MFHGGCLSCPHVFSTRLIYCFHLYCDVLLNLVLRFLPIFGLSDANMPLFCNVGRV